MNLYGSSSFSGFSSFSDWEPVSRFQPNPADYTPIQPAFQPQISDYVPINTSTISQPDITAFEPVRTQDFIPAEQPVSHTRHYTEQELREIGSRPTEEIVAFFNNIGGNTRSDTYTDEETGITFTNTIYSSPLLDNKEFYVTDRDRSYWQTGNDALIVDGEVIVPPTSVAKKSLPLTETEIQRILAAQQGMLPEEPQYEPVADTAIGQGSDFPGGLATDTADNLSADLTRSQIQASVVGDAIADMRPPVDLPSDTAAQPPAALPEQAPPSAEQPQTQAAQSENPVPSADTAQAPPAAEAEKHPEEIAKSLAGDAASQINTAADLLAKPLEERAQVLQRTAELKSELAATYANGMITFQNGEMPADAAGFYARNPGALNETVVTIREQAENIRKMAGEDAGKAYFFGAMGKLAGGVGNGLDVMELGSRLNKAYHEDTPSNWDSVYGQLTKMMVGAAGGVVAVGAARAAGMLIAGFFGGAPIVATLIVGVGLTVGVSLVADFIESEISKGNTILSAPVEDVTDLVLVGDMHLPIDARLRADNVTVFGNQRFNNLEVEADKLEVVGSLSAEGNFIVQAEEASVTPSENISQTLLEKSQAEAVAQAQQNGADSAAESESSADVTAENSQSEIPQQPADTQAALPESAENGNVIGYDSPENILPDGSRIDDEMFLYDENQESLLSQPVTENPVPANETVAYSDTVTSDIGNPDIYDDYILYY